MDALHVFAWIAGALVVGFAAGALLVYIKLKLRQHEELKAARKESVARSRSTLKGQIAEQLAPVLAGFPYAPSDARFLGDPIDYVVFNGYTQLKDGEGPADELEVVILDIKQGGARLSATQQAIARAVAAGRVRFEVIHIDDAGGVSVRQAPGT